MEELLARLDLSQFAPVLHSEGVDLNAAVLLSEDDFKELGLNLGARKKLYNALHGSVASSGAPTPMAKAQPVGASVASHFKCKCSASAVQVSRLQIPAKCCILAPNWRL